MSLLPLYMAQLFLDCAIPLLNRNLHCCHPKGSFHKSVPWRALWARGFLVFWVGFLSSPRIRNWCSNVLLKSCKLKTQMLRPLLRGRSATGGEGVLLKRKSARSSLIHKLTNSLIHKLTNSQTHIFTHSKKLQPSAYSSRCGL